MRIRSQQDFASGLTFLCVGAGFAAVSAGYAMGTAARMGPGYFPFGLGVMLAVLGAIILVKSLSPATEEDHLTAWNVRGLFLILGSVALFAALLSQLGLVAAIIATVIISALADRGFRLLGVIATAGVVTLICVLGFVYGMGMPMPVWPPLLAR